MLGMLLIKGAVSQALLHTSPRPTYKEGGLLMRRTIPLLTTMALTLLVASGVALALTKIGTDGPDYFRGTNGTTSSSARAVTTYSILKQAMTTS